jgi:hypothetical protein
MTDIFANPALWPYISRSVDPNQIQAIFASPAFAQDLAGGQAAGVQATFNNQLTNIVRTLQDGLQASLRYSIGTKHNRFSAFALANYLLRDTYRLTPGTPLTSVLNNIGQPPNIRARSGVTWGWNDLKTTLNLNYTDGYRNTLIVPMRAVSPWTTLDFQLAWTLPTSTLPVENVQATFNARNLLSANPPWVTVPPGAALRPVGFDAANASPFGRRLSLELSVSW